jgi:hypothetical protein
VTEDDTSTLDSIPTIDVAPGVAVVASELVVFEKGSTGGSVDSEIPAVVEVEEDVMEGAIEEVKEEGIPVEELLLENSVTSVSVIPVPVLACTPNKESWDKDRTSLDS